jgi:hypothetical protein
MKYRKYMELMRTPFEELTKEQQKLRKEEFKRRLNVCKKFLTGMMNGYVNEDIKKDIAEDDPMQEALDVLIVRINEIEGEA